MAHFAVRAPLRLLTSSLYLSSFRPSNFQPANIHTTYQRVMSISTFKLDPMIFNRALYERVSELWFPGVDTSGQALDMSVAKRWFMPTPEERLAFDGQCRAAFAQALESIGPDKFSDASAQPLLDEIQRVAAEEAEKDNETEHRGEEAAWTALSLTLLLDQMPRNIYRTGDGLRLVYTHYDRLGYSLARSLLSPSSPIPRPDKHPIFRLSAAHRTWFYLPLMHSEDLAAHKFAGELVDEYTREVENLDEYNGTKTFLESHKNSLKEHTQILERFGRYPHRNGALGRESTDEERRFMEDGGASFGVGQTKDSDP
ncbi:class I alpha-mannosidase [Pyrenophora seminiperda CCB06]|uniref:Class I alpha-mannosidase n=1 Tax=Pyrenophora seminiperda CCB06 TaxID=1302712 RepID=A0A3M7LX64_9PLEO|nr:class I alpha-mannosidase [Pyrenophora seminiperda CCB06]